MKLMLRPCVGNTERVPGLFEEDYPCPYSPLQGQQQKLLPSGHPHCSGKSKSQAPCWHNSIKTNGLSSLEIIALKLFASISPEKENRPSKEIKDSVIDCQYLKFNNCELREDQHLEKKSMYPMDKITPKHNKHTWVYA